MKRILLFFLFSTAYSIVYSQTKETKNVILMIPDGTSMSVITLSRWYKTIEETHLNDELLNKAINEGTMPLPLCFDELLCGVVMTHSANGLISESAPAATEMATGKKSDPGFLGIATDSTPYVTVLELARIKKNKSTGVVVTCEFPHATPAAFAAHCLDRKDYTTIKKQMMHNQLDVVFGGGYGGSKVLLPEDKKTLESLGYAVVNRFEDLNNFAGNKVWGLFNTDTSYNGYMAFDLDRKTLAIKEPSLAQMTEKAIQVLEKNNNGFFLMVEGSKVDWAAHLNDPVGVVSEFLAFERAVKVALDYAKKNKNTVVIICTDHGNGGFSIGNKFSDKKTNFNNNPNYIQYNHLPYKTIINNLKKYELTGDGFERVLENANRVNKPETFDVYLKKYYDEYNSGVLQTNPTVMNDSIHLYFKTKKIEDRKLTSKMGINNYISDNAYIGWTTKGHTGEDIPLYIYHPDGFTLHGTVDNTKIAAYMAEVMGLGTIDTETNKKYFSAYNLTTHNNYTATADTLTFLKQNDTYTFLINTNVYYKNGIKKNSESLNLKINNNFYTSANILKLYQLEDKKNESNKKVEKK